MAHGGPRPNAGRKPGAATKITEKARRAALEGGISPLDYMLTILRDEVRSDDERFEAAKAAAPYVHAKLSSIEAKVDQTNRNVVALPEAAESVDAWKAGVSVRH